MNKKNIVLSMVNLKTSLNIIDTLKKFLNKSIESDSTSITYRIELIEQYIKETIEFLERVNYNE